MNFSSRPALAQNPQFLRDWNSLSARMDRTSGPVFSADISPEQLHHNVGIEQALIRIEEAGRGLASQDSIERTVAAQGVLEVYRAQSDLLREEIAYYAKELAHDRVGGTDPFAYAARLMVAAATTIKGAAREANDTTTLREVVTSLEAVVSGLARSESRDAQVLSLALESQT